MVTIGEGEKKEKLISIKKRDEKEISKVNLEEFIEKLNEEISNKS